MNAEELFSKLKEYGADISGINDRFMGDADLYEMCLGDFFSDVNFAKLESAVSSSEHQNAFEAAHALKGLSGNLGLQPFYEKICVLVEALRAKDYSHIGAQYKDVSGALSDLARAFPNYASQDKRESESAETSESEPEPEPEPEQEPEPGPESAQEPELQIKPEPQPAPEFAHIAPAQAVSWEYAQPADPDDVAPAAEPQADQTRPYEPSYADKPRKPEYAEKPPKPSYSKKPRKRRPAFTPRVPAIKTLIAKLKKNFDDKGPNVLIISVALVLVVLFVVFLFVNTINNYNKTNSSSNAVHLEEICFQLKLYVEENMDNNWKVANSIASAVSKSNITDDARELLSFVRDQRDIWGVTDVIIYTESGLGVNSTGEITPNDVVSQTLYDARAKGEYLTIIDSELIYTIPVETEMKFQNSPIAAVSVSHDISTFLDNMGFSSFDGNAVIYLAQSNGAIISSLTHKYAVGAYNIKSLLEKMGVRHIDGRSVSADHIFSHDEPQTYLITAPEGVEYVVCSPITVHQSGMRLFYVVPEELVNEVTRNFSGFITLMSAVLVTIVLAGTMIIFIMIYNSSKRHFDEEMLSREHMYELLAKNTQTAFGFYRAGQPAPVYASKNVKSVIGRKALLLENTPDGFSMQSVESDKGLPDGDITLINDAMRDWDGSSQFTSGYIKNESSKKPSFYELQMSRASENGDEFVCIARNATVAYERENALKDALGMAESANRAKSRFLSNMSHDIRTPMNAIVNMTNFAIETMEDPKRLAEYLFTIRKSSDHLLNLINDVLTMSRIDSGKASLNEEAFDLMELLNRTSDIIKPLCKSKNLIFITDFSGVAEKALVGDHVKLSQILMNLLSNAVKYTPNNGAVRFSALQLPSLSEDIVDLRFTVEDNGIGIPRKYLDTIFEPFSRVDSKRTSGIEGSGLGLSICHSYVVAMGGTVKCESEEGNGSTFTTELFFKKASGEVKAPEFKPVRMDQPYLGKRCLLCEDNQTNLTIAKTMLERLGFLVDEASDGWEGVSMFKRSKPWQYDIIYMDIQMPVMDGYEATVAIRESEHAQAKVIPIIAMTANVFAEDIEKARIAGMDGHIGKPIFTIDLVRETDRVFDKQRGM